MGRGCIEEEENAHDVEGITWGINWMNDEGIGYETRGHERCVYIDMFMKGSGWPP